MLTVQVHGYTEGPNLQQLLEKIGKASSAVAENTDVRTEILQSHCQLRGTGLTTPHYLLILGSDKTETMEFITILQEIGVRTDVSYLILDGNLYACQMH
jgi:hypothetical protein